MSIEKDPFDDRSGSPVDPVTDYRPRLSSPCNLPDLPSSMSGIILDILMTHFASAEQIFLPEIRSLLWRPTEADRKIIIEEFSNWNPKQAGQRPSIVVRREAATSTRIGIFDEVNQFVMDGGGLEFIREWRGAHSIVVADLSGLRADRIAGEVRQHLQVFSSRICEMLNISFFEVQQLGRVEKPEMFKAVEGAKDLFGVSVSIGYTFTETWRLPPQAPLLSAARFSVDLE